jgi:diamine N-acetyltransferase
VLHHDASVAQFTARPHMSAKSDLVSLRQITAQSVRSVCSLTVAKDQEGLLAPNAVSLAQALFAPNAWYRAIYLSEKPVGFVMLEDESLLPPRPDVPKIRLWRFMIDARFQGQGIGKAALLQVIDHVRSKDLFSVLSTSYVPRPGSAELFYIGLGFRHTGRVERGEIVLELPLAQSVV